MSDDANVDRSEERGQHLIFTGGMTLEEYLQGEPPLEDEIPSFVSARWLGEMGRREREGEG